MSSAKKILDEIRKGVASETLSQKIPWEKLVEPDLAELIKFTRDQPDVPESYNLLDYLFRISREKDLWFSVEVLGNAVQYQKMSLDDRKSILLSMRKRLDQIKDKIAVEVPIDVNLRRYWIFEAAYYAVNGATLNETGHAIDAVQNYQIARGIYEQLGLFQQADKFTDIIHKLNSNKATRVLRPTAILVHSQIQPQPGEEKKNGPLSAPVKSFPQPHSQLPANQPVESQPLAFIRNTAPLVSEVKANSPAAEDVHLHHAPPLVEESIAPQPAAWAEKELNPTASPGVVPNDELIRLADQIQQQTEILALTHLQIQMFLSRRSILASEVQNLERKIEGLKQKLDRLEKKEKTVESKEQKKE